MATSQRSTPKLSAQDPAGARIGEIIRILHDTYPDAACELNHDSPWQLLIATILSAQCTDVRVNQVTPALFAAYPTPADLAVADPAAVEEIIRTTGFYRNKAKSVIGASQRVAEVYGGEAPRTMEEMLTLPGAARKTSNVVLGVAYGIASGIVVDTHVRRLSNRLALTTHDDPEKIERDLQLLVPESEWIDFSHLLIFHGRRCCDAKKPDCARCSIRHLCPSSRVVETA